MRNQFWFRVAALFGLSAVGLGAFGAHALKAQLAAANQTHTWETAVLYHFLHAVALLVVASCDGMPRVVKLCFTVGIILFSGSLYVLALGGPKWLGPITPLGGVAWMLGWGWLAFARSQTGGISSSSVSRDAGNQKLGS